MLPPMNAYSMAATTVSMPLIRPVAVITASLRPVAAMLASSREWYGLVSVNLSGSVDVSPWSYACHSPSKSARSRSAALKRK